MSVLLRDGKYVLRQEEFENMINVHVKDSAMSQTARCGDGGDLTWTSPASARQMATCPECLSNVLSDTCSMCNGSRVIKNYDEITPCGGCGFYAAEYLIERRDRAK